MQTNIRNAQALWEQVLAEEPPEPCPSIADPMPQETLDALKTVILNSVEVWTTP